MLAEEEEEDQRLPPLLPPPPPSRDSTEVVTPARLYPKLLHVATHGRTLKLAAPPVPLKCVSARTGGTPGAGTKSLKQPTYPARNADAPDTAVGSARVGVAL